MDRNLYMRYVILLVIGCLGAVASIVVGIYIYIKEDLREYINLGLITKFNSKKKFEKQKTHCIEAKSIQLVKKASKSLENTGLINENTTLLDENTTLLSDEKMNQ
ncbi:MULTISPECIES: hypothetical protein [Clostridium]|uniref:Uncharacterized protein n=1 Tax=Clostridium frigoriphilum TaxID=443253 RepID=A0ABU7USZ4_9CLOT|nr:hypothetical protein [Clostridium sp. DSM 17811]MBU3101261.1 hypothetical protein [Clostridium sp. DSM 17811]